MCRVDQSGYPYFYALEIAGLKIMWTQGFPLTDLMYLTINQKLKRVKQNEYVVQENTNHIYMNNTTRFNLQLLNRIKFSEIDIFLICEQVDLLLLNYLIKYKQFKPKVICTYATYMLGQHLGKELYQLSEMRNRYFYSFVEDYNKEEESFKLFEDHYNINFQEFTDTMPQREYECTLVNFGQLIKIPFLEIQESLQIEALSSGTELGGSAYSLSIGNYFTIVIAKQLNNLNQNCIHKSISSKIYDCDYLLYGVESQIIDNSFLNETCINLNHSQNVVIPFNSYQMILELQDEIDSKLKHQCHKIFILSQEFYNYLLIANSLVEYLNDNLQQQIFKDPPLNPLNRLMNLIKQQIVIVAKSLEDIKFEGYSLVESVNANTPSVYFIFDSSLRLNQSLFLFDILEQVGLQKASTIYTQFADEIDSEKSTFTLQLIDPEFSNDDRLLQEIKNAYKFKIQKSFSKNSDQFQLPNNNKIKAFLVPEGSNQTFPAIHYKMLQKKILSLNQIIVPLQIHKSGQGNKVIGQIELSKIEIFIKDAKEATIKKEEVKNDIYYIMGDISKERISQLASEISNVTATLPYELQLNKLTFKNSNNETQIIVDLLQNEAIVSAKTQQEIEIVSKIVYRVLGVRKL